MQDREKQTNDKKLERRAKALLIDKDIPRSKMQIVRSLLNNKDLTPNERYKAVIDIIDLCPDKQVKFENDSKSTNFRNPPKIKTEIEIDHPLYSSETGFYINEIYYRYKNLKLFRKRYLIHGNNRFGIGIKKRLIPTKKLLKALREIVSFQDKILSRLPEILMAILKNESIEEPLHFNYLRAFRRWMMETPIIKYSQNEIKWMDRYSLEAELESYIINFFSFMKLDSETREQIILLVENTLRASEELSKEKIVNEDPESLRIEKEKRNLKKERIIYDYMMTLRAFLPAKVDSENIISNHIKLNYRIETFPEFLIIVMEALVFQKEIDFNYISSYYEIKPLRVNSEEWDYSGNLLKEIGKDPESRKKRRIENLKKELIPYDELYSFLKLKIEEQNVLQRAFENQWKIVDKKHKDHSNVYNDDFFSYIDDCINFFNNCYLSLLNGSILYLEDKTKGITESSIFTPSSFLNEVNSLSSLLDEIHIFKTENPSLVISRDEILRILQGKLRSMSHIERYILLIGDLFYQIAEKLHILYGLHRLWVLQGCKLIDPDIVITPLRIERDIEVENPTGRPIPFYNYKIIGFKDTPVLSKLLVGKNILTDNTKGGLFIHMTSFSYQLAYECMHDKIFTRLDERKSLLKKIQEGI